jgi:hypothetical protein
VRVQVHQVRRPALSLPSSVLVMWHACLTSLGVSRVFDIGSGKAGLTR